MRLYQNYCKISYAIIKKYETFNKAEKVHIYKETKYNSSGLSKWHKTFGDKTEIIEYS